MAFYKGGNNPLAEVEPRVADDELERGTARETSPQQIADLVHFLESLSTLASGMPQLFPKPAAVPSGLPPSAAPTDQRAGLELNGD